MLTKIRKRIKIKLTFSGQKAPKGAAHRPSRDFEVSENGSFPVPIPQSQPLVTAIFPTNPVPGQYKGWHFYHPTEGEK